MTDAEFQSLLKRKQRVELTVANWLLVTDAEPCRSVAEERNLAPAAFDAASWRGKSNSYLKETHTFNDSTVFWHMQGKNPACDLLCYLRDVPSASVLGRILLGSLQPRRGHLAVEQFRSKVFDQRYIKVEVKSSEHRHHDKLRAPYQVFLAEYESSGKPSGWSVSKADLAVCCARNYCDNERTCGTLWLGGPKGQRTCEDIHAARAKSHPNDPRDDYGYYVLAMTAMRHLIAEKAPNNAAVVSCQNNRAKNLELSLNDDLREYTFLREAVAKQYASLLPPRNKQSW